MSRIAVLIVVLGLSLVCIVSGWAADMTPAEEQAVAEIKRLGGTVTFEDNSPFSSVIGVDLHYGPLPCPVSPLTDAGLACTKGLHQLRQLRLSGTQITDAGLVHIEGLPHLKTLDLCSTSITDTGLDHLKRLTGLRKLDLCLTGVTANGVKRLQQALPQCKIDCFLLTTWPLTPPSDIDFNSYFKPRPTLEKPDQPRQPFPVPEGVRNLALKKKVTASDMQPIIGELARIVDGEKDGCLDAIVELGGWDKRPQWVQIDVGATASVYAVVVWHFFCKRVYHGVVVQVSDDPRFAKGVRTIFNNDFNNSLGLGRGKDLEYIEDPRGKLIDGKDATGQPVKGRYVRLYSNGYTTGRGDVCEINHYIEVEVYGKAD